MITGTTPLDLTNQTNRDDAEAMDGVSSIGEAKTHLSRLIARVEAGEEIVLRRGAEPVAKLVRYREPLRPRTPGALRGQMHIGEDFDDPLPEFAPYSAV